MDNTVYNVLKLSFIAVGSFSRNKSQVFISKNKGYIRWNIP